MDLNLSLAESVLIESASVKQKYHPEPAGDYQHICMLFELYKPLQNLTERKLKENLQLKNIEMPYTIFCFLFGSPKISKQSNKIRSQTD